MKAIYKSSTKTYFSLYGNMIEERTKHLLFWGLFSFTMTRTFFNKTV
ncbi:hypothetical protein SAMN06264346_1026 [Chryseobacterium profundimaris]|uniref:Uncharacterized protein n=1 Tax=Chryseobacterium profundimaris TaxID=1387275 RepID=A0ABY1NG45_9FLAO|nr:hypothetical protein SAMN06264346_1026 [Chryseobacterium profundimaris]